MRDLHPTLRGAVVALLLSVLLVSCNSSTNTNAPGGGGELNGSLDANGGQFAHTFSSAGVLAYRCTIHPTCGGLAGSITVVNAGTPVRSRVLAISISGGGAGVYGTTCSGLSLQADTVFVGDAVTWTNASPLTHTVTSQ